MKVFVATARGQGGRVNDYCYTTEGELVSWPLITCTGEEIDGNCGCRRGLAGTESSRATTTFTVAERADLDLASYAWSLGAAMAKDGWELTDDEAMEEAHEMARLASGFSVGSILERRGDEVVVRAAA